VLPQGLNMLGQRCITRHQCTSVAECPEVFRRIETERAGQPGSPRPTSLARSSMCLTSVFENPKAVLVGDALQRHHVCELSEQVHGEEQIGPVRERGFRGRRVEVVVALGDIDEDRRASGLHDSFDRRGERQRGNDDLAPPLEPFREQRQPQGVQSAGDSNALRGPAVRGECGFELANLGPVRERPGADRSLECLEDRLLERFVRRREVEERNQRPGSEKLVLHDLSLDDQKPDSERACCAGMRLLTGARPDPSRALAVGTNLATDAVATEVVRELEQRGIRTLVLRGPAIARWLYREGERDYGDVDLLVEPDSVERAEETLRELGFRGRPLQPLKHRQPRHAEMWVRGTTPPVDLHRTIVGVAASDREVWATLWAHSKSIALQGTAVKTLDHAGLLVLLTLHAAQHGLEAATRDLAVALTRVGSEEWEQACELATQLKAVPAFGVGLRMFPAGREIADRFGIHAGPIPEMLLRSEVAPDLALGLNWAADLPTARLRARFVASKVFPDPDSMRESSGIARRGRAGLAAAYLQRLLWLSIRAPRAIRAVRRARRRASEASGR
jgi:hypothetical protein